MSGSFKVTTARDGGRSFRDQYTSYNNDDQDGQHGNYSTYSNRRGNRKKFSGNRGNRGRYNSNRGQRGGANPRSRFDEDGDASMGDVNDSAQSASRYNPYGARPPSRRGHRTGSAGGGRLAMDDKPPGAMSRLGLPVGNRGRGRGDRSDRGDNYRGKQESWFKITIPHGEKLGKDFVLKSINSVCEFPFLPLKFHFENKTAVFYLNDERAANAVRNVSKKITVPNGFKMVIISRSCPPPETPLDEEAIEKIKVSMSKRYNVPDKYLDLSNWFHDADLKADGIRLTLAKRTNMELVMKIIEENIPELCGLNLSNNRITILDTIGSIADKTPNLVRLDLSKNQVRSEQLDRIKNFKLVELNLEENAVRDRFKEQSAYVSFIRKKFPKVMKLDGIDLPPPITFEVESPTSLPRVSGSYFMNDSIQELLVKFVKQFFEVYDGDDRQGLLDAYHNDAMFSMAVSFNKMMTKQAHFGEYLPDSRNLNRISGEKRFKLLKNGKANIVSQLSLLPKTTHDFASFTLDVTCSLESLLAFTISGIFKEPNNIRGSDCVYRHFSRSFIAVPAGAGILISNDQLSITNATPEQIKKSFTTPAPTPSPSPVAGASAVPSSALSDAQKQEMVKLFAEKSGMNLQFSLQCLEQNSWDFDVSAKVFTDLKAQGKLPPEAFV